MVDGPPSDPLSMVGDIMKAVTDEGGLDGIVKKLKDSGKQSDASMRMQAETLRLVRLIAAKVGVT